MMKNNNMKDSKVMTIGDLRKAIVDLPDDMDVSSIQELFPNKGVKQLITLKDYQDAGVFNNAMPNGFNLYDDNREDDEDGTSLCLNNIYNDVLDCPVVSICADDEDMVICAIFVDASKFRDDEIKALVKKANAEKLKELREKYCNFNS